jgi:hypothetical protein
MRRILLVVAIGIAIVVGVAFSQQPVSPGPYKVVQVAKVGGAGGFEDVYADAAGRRLYIPRSGPNPRITVFDLGTLAPVGEISNASGRSAVVDPKSGHGFASSKPVVMWDSKTLATIKTIDVEGRPDEILFDAFNEHVYVIGRGTPNVTVIDAKDGSVVGTVDLGGGPEEAVADGKGRVYVALEDKSSIAVVDVKTLAVTARYDLSAKGGSPSGLAYDAKNGILFAACHDPQNMVMLNASDGKIIAALPIGSGTDGATFNPNTIEAFSSQADGTLTVIKENSPAEFVVEQNVPTMAGAKTLTLDSKTNRIFLITAEYAAPAPPPNPPTPSTDAPAQASSTGSATGQAVGGRGGRGRGGRGRGPMVPDSFTILAVGK